MTINGHSVSTLNESIPRRSGSDEVPPALAAPVTEEPVGGGEVEVNDGASPLPTPVVVDFAVAPVGTAAAALETPVVPAAAAPL